MDLDFTTIYKDLTFLSESVRLQYTNFIWRHKDRFNQYLSYDDALQRLRMEEPIEYVFNMAEFCGLTFYIDKRCLIPRHETEEIVRRATEFLKNLKKKKITVVDIGTGSGCIILSLANILAQRNEDLQCTCIGVDISDDALEVARINRKAFNLVDKVTLVNKSFQELDFSRFENLIVCSNLPYIPDNERLQPSVVQHEPHLALFGGKSGDELNNELLNKLRNLTNLQAVFMEGYNGEITTYLPGINI